VQQQLVLRLEPIYNNIRHSELVGSNIYLQLHLNRFKIAVSLQAHKLGLQTKMYIKLEKGALSPITRRKIK
jgi:hypothetical protein